MENNVSSMNERGLREQVLTRRSCQGAAIQGSSLLSTAEEVRALLSSGQALTINGVQYCTSKQRSPSSWPPKTIQLERDFAGETDFAASVEWEMVATTTSRAAPPQRGERRKRTDKREEPQVVSGNPRKPHRLAPIVREKENRTNAQSPREQQTQSHTHTQSHTQTQTQTQTVDVPSSSSSSAANNKAHKPEQEKANALPALIKTESHQAKQQLQRKLEREKRLANIDREREKQSQQMEKKTPRETPKETPREGSTEEQQEDGDRVSAARRLAQERVLRRIKEEREKMELAEKERLAKIEKELERNALKVQRLQEKTEERVQALKEKEKERIIEERSQKEEEEFRRFQANEKAQSESAKAKMRLLRKEAAMRRKSQAEHAQLLEQTKQQEIAKRLAENAQRLTPLPAVNVVKRKEKDTNMKEASISDKEREREKASQSLISHLSAILGEGGSEMEADDEPPSISIREKQPLNSSEYTLSAENLLLLENERRKTMVDDERPFSESTSLAYKQMERDRARERGKEGESLTERGRGRQGDDESAREVKMLLGKPGIAFADEDLTKADSDKDEDSLVESRSPTQKPMKSNKKGHVQFSPVPSKELDLKESPAKWLEKELEEKDEEDTWGALSSAHSPPKIAAQTGQSRDDDSDTNSDFSDLTDHEERERFERQKQTVRKTVSPRATRIKATNNKEIVKSSPVESSSNMSQQASTASGSTGDQKSDKSNRTKKKKPVYRRLPPIPIPPFNPIPS